MLADHYHWARPLRELMTSMTQREFEARLKWICDDADKPSRSDWYAMSIATEIRRLRTERLNGNSSRVTLTDLKLLPIRPKSKDEKVKEANLSWSAFLGVPLG